MKKKIDSPLEDDLRPEYDLSQLKLLARGRSRVQPDQVSVILEPDVAKMFPDAAAVNQALRFLSRVTQQEVKASQGGK